MKKYIAISLIIVFAFVGKSQNLDTFFKTIVLEGNVNYKLVKETKQEELTNLINKLNAEIVTAPTKSAYINLYNLLVIKQVVNNYPTASPTAIPGFFDTNKFLVGDKNITLNDLENKIIRPTYKDARVHFALVCGAISCPPIQNFAYNEKELNNQLDSVTTWAINDPNFIQIDEEGKIKISEIFKWYASDFGGSAKNVTSFINKYKKGEISSFSYYPYDWGLNDQTKSLSNIAAYTPSVLLKKGQFEIVLFNNMYTQTGGFGDDGKKSTSDTRNTWNTTMMTFNFGASKSARFNIGLDVNLRSVRNDNADSYAANILKFEQNDNNRTTISTIGPKLKWNPLKSIPKFSMQSTFWIPVAKELEGTPWLDWQRYTSWTQFFYDKTFGTKYQLFTELAAWVRIPEIGSDLGLKKTTLETPISVFFSYFPTKKSTVYAQLQYWPVVSSFPNYFAQGGIGGKYQILKQLQLEASYTNFFTGKNQGAGATFNLGLRFISK